VSLTVSRRAARPSCKETCPINACPSDPDSDLARIRAALDQLLADPAFVRAPQMSAFLRYVVEQTLGGSAERIKAYTIGVDALGKPADFDPQTDPSVRVLAKRLRDRLQEHYAHHVDALLRIELVSGCYTPRFVEAGDQPSDSPPGHGGLPRIETRPIASRSTSTERHAGARGNVTSIDSAQRPRPSEAPSNGPPDAPVLYLIVCQTEDRMAQRIAVLLSGMLSRDHGVDARRVERAPAHLSPDDRSLTLHVTRFGAEVRVDLQVCRSISGEIARADVLTLQPGSDDTFARQDFERLERWAGGYSKPRRAARQDILREPLAGWLAGGRERGARASSPDDEASLADRPDAPRRIVGR